MVRFYNSDGTLLGYQIVATGSDAVYDGAELTDPSGAGNPFVGFEPSPTAVTADMDCYAVFKDPWADVFAAIADGTYKTKFAIGDTVPLDLGSEGVVNMQIAAFDLDVLADGSGTAAISWVSKELLATAHRMNPGLVTNDDGTYQEGTGNIGGWEKCELRSYLENTIKPMIPDKVRSSIRAVTLTQHANDTGGNYVSQTTTDNVWILGQKEIYTYGGNRYAALFPDNASRVKTQGGTVEEWWCRDVAKYNNTCFNNVSTNGAFQSSVTGNGATNSFGVCICFCT